MNFKLIDTRLYSNPKQTKFRVAFKNENGANSIKTFSDKSKAMAFREETKPLSKRIAEINNPMIDQSKSEMLEMLDKKESKGRGRPRNQEVEINEIFNPIREAAGDFVIIMSRDTKILNHIVSSYIK